MELLLALGEPAEELCEEFLAHARGRLEEELRSLEAVSYTHLTLPTTGSLCRSRWSPYH